MMSGSYGDLLPLPDLDQHRELLKLRTIAAMSMLGGFGIRIPKIVVRRYKPTLRCSFCGTKKFSGVCPGCKREES